MEVEKNFQNFKNLEPLFNILSPPFSSEADSTPEDIQLGLLDQQADYDLKENFKSALLLEFYGCLPAAAFPHLKKLCCPTFVTIWVHIHLLSSFFWHENKQV